MERIQTGEITGSTGERIDKDFCSFHGRLAHASRRMASATSIEDVLRRMPSNFTLIDRDGGKHPTNLDLLIGWSDYFRTISRDKSSDYPLDLPAPLVNHLIDYLHGRNFGGISASIKDLFSLIDQTRLWLLDDYAQNVEAHIEYIAEGSNAVQILCLANERNIDHIVNSTAYLIETSLLSADCFEDGGCCHHKRGDFACVKNKVCCLHTAEMRQTLANLTPADSKIVLMALAKRIAYPGACDQTESV